MLPEKIRNNKLFTEEISSLAETFKEKLHYEYRSKLLADLKDALKSAPPVDALKNILTNNWGLVKGSTLCYTTHPEGDLTLLLCDIADYISEATKEAPIKILMPDILTESFSEAYPNLDTIDIRSVLKTHILSDLKNYLIPIRILTELKGSWEDRNEELNNYYYDYSKSALSSSYINTSEFTRLSGHSPHTQALIESKNRYEQALNDTGLLSHLRALIVALSFNSTSGIGTEASAGQGAYWAISQFNDYYVKLGDEIKAKIPSPVKEEIDKLIHISSNATANIEATRNNDTCINTRQTNLSEQVKAHEAALMAISINDESKRELLEQSKTLFELNQAVLREQLDKETYHGHDNLSVTYQLLETFQVKPTIHSSAECQDFLTLSADEIKLIAEKEKTIPKGIIRQLSTLESLVLFCIETRLESLKAILSTVVGEALIAQFIRKPSHVSACLIFLQGDRLEAILSALKDTLPQIIKSSHDFQTVLQFLSPEQCTVVCEALQDKLPQIIQSSDDFGNALQFLSPEQRTVAFEALQDKLPQIIHRSHDFRAALEFLSPEQCRVVCETLKDKFPQIIQTSDDFQTVLQFLHPKQRTVVYEALQNKLPQIIQSSHDFQTVLQFLHPGQRTVVCETLKDKLPQIIQTSHDFGRVLEFLRPEQRTVVCETLKDKLPQIIQTSHDFGRVLEFLRPEQRTVVCETLKDKLPQIIQTGDDFRWTLLFLTSEQSKIICEAFNKNKLQEIFSACRRQLSLEKQAAIEAVLLVKESKETDVMMLEGNTPVFTPGRKRPRKENIQKDDSSVFPSKKQTPSP